MPDPAGERGARKSGTSRRGQDPLIRQAKMVLDYNWTGSYTRPGPRLYPHQWSWDSAFIAMGYARYDTERAVKELSHLLDNQWENGLLPQIVFNQSFADQYFPGTSFWHAECEASAVCTLTTSGVVQPPVHATAALAVYWHAEDERAVDRFLEDAYPRLAAWHDYLYGERDPEDEWLVYIRHPWESGMDNAPTWDQILQRMQLRPDEVPEYRRVDTHIVSAGDRPEKAAYYRFAYLVRLFSSRDYDENRIREGCPFLVQDVLFNALLCQGEEDLAQIARLLGENPSLHEGRAEKTADAINWKLWDEGHATYLDFDLITGQPIRVYAAAGYLPLYAGNPNEKQARLMLESLKNTGFRLEDEGVMPVPSYDPYGYGFPPVQYWRSPVWINIDWLLMRGLECYGFDKQTQHLRHTIVDLVRNTGFYEYFHPIDGTGHGSDLFSWTAALFLNVLMDGRPVGGGLCRWSTVPGDDR